VACATPTQIAVDPTGAEHEKGTIMSTQEFSKVATNTPAAATKPSRVRQPSKLSRHTPEGRRPTQRISLLLGQRTSLSRVMLSVLSVALILGLIGFAAHALWVVTIIVMALGLGYVIANSRRDRADSVNQRQEDELDAARRG
jgi:Flp pilus assembly protein TadB